MQGFKHQRFGEKPTAFEKTLCERCTLRIALHQGTPHQEILEEPNRPIDVSVEPSGELIRQERVRQDRFPQASIVTAMGASSSRNLCRRLPCQTAAFQRVVNALTRDGIAKTASIPDDVDGNGGAGELIAAVRKLKRVRVKLFRIVRQMLIA